MDTIELDIEAPAERDPETPLHGASSLAMLHAPEAALEAARRLYRHSRSGVRFFCENRRVVPVDQLEALGELGELGEFGELAEDSSAALAAASSLAKSARSTM
ncbi:MAG TPA: hypothetical protein VK047_08255 [Zeimonas sp.]|nr:hypothetical protein [Zeimonas sp.]